MNAQQKVEAEAETPSNLRIWDALAKTDPAQTKQFSRAGGFKGTAVKPMWVNKRLTEMFGPCGSGWGSEKPTFTTVPGQDGEVLVYCTVEAWYREAGSPAPKDDAPFDCDHYKSRVYGVGGDKVATWVGQGDKRRLVHDDEAFKKAYTDALGNAFKFVGVAADIHMGLFDDNKYVAAVAKEFEDVERQKVPGISGIKKRLNFLMREGDGATDLEMFNGLVHDHKNDLQAIKDANHEYWTGDGEDSEGFKAWIVRRREELAETAESASYQLLVSTLMECTTRPELDTWTTKNMALVDILSDEERRKFEEKYDAAEAALLAVGNVGAG